MIIKTTTNNNLSVDGWKGDDVIKTGSGSDEIYGGEGNDEIDGGSGNDTIFGQAGNDNIRGGSGDDIIYGQGGDDYIYASDGFDFLSGGDGSDTVSFELLSNGILADLVFGAIFTNEDTMDEESIANYVVIEFDENKAWYNFEFLVGTPDNDVIIAADHTAMEYIGGEGDDEIYGGAQGEIIDGGAGHDILTGGDGADTFRISVEDELPDIISDFSADDIVDLTRLGIGSKDELSLKEETLVINDFEYSGTILSRTEPEGSEETALLLFINENHTTFLTDNNPLENINI